MRRGRHGAAPKLLPTTTSSRRIERERVEAGAARAGDVGRGTPGARPTMSGGKMHLGEAIIHQGRPPPSCT